MEIWKRYLKEMAYKRKRKKADNSLIYAKCPCDVSLPMNFLLQLQQNPISPPQPGIGGVREKVS